MKWDEPPLWPVAAPSLLGFIAACIPHLVDGVPRLFDWDLTTPFLLLVILSPLLFFSPEPAGGSKELIIGANIGMLVAFLPQLIFFPWFIIVILAWIFQSMVVWRKNFPAFRVGTWIGLGSVSGLFMGALFAHFVI